MANLKVCLAIVAIAVFVCLSDPVVARRSHSNPIAVNNGTNHTGPGPRPSSNSTNHTGPNPPQPPPPHNNSTNHTGPNPPQPPPPNRNGTNHTGSDNGRVVSGTAAKLSARSLPVSNGKCIGSDCPSNIPSIPSSASSDSSDEEDEDDEADQQPQQPRPSGNGSFPQPPPHNNGTNHTGPNPPPPNNNGSFPQPPPHNNGTNHTGPNPPPPNNNGSFPQPPPHNNGTNHTGPNPPPPNNNGSFPQPPPHNNGTNHTGPNPPQPNNNGSFPQPPPHNNGTNHTGPNPPQPPPKNNHTKPEHGSKAECQTFNDCVNAIGGECLSDCTNSACVLSGFDRCRQANAVVVSVLLTKDSPSVKTIQKTRRDIVDLLDVPSDSVVFLGQEKNGNGLLFEILDSEVMTANDAVFSLLTQVRQQTKAVKKTELRGATVSVIRA